MPTPERRGAAPHAGGRLNGLQPGEISRGIKGVAGVRGRPGRGAWGIGAVAGREG